MQRIVKVVAVTAALGIVALGAAGSVPDGPGRPCTTAPQNQYLPAAELQARAAAQGYRIDHISIGRTCAALRATGPGGTRVELFMDPASGTVVAKK